MWRVWGGRGWGEGNPHKIILKRYFTSVYQAQTASDPRQLAWWTKITRTVFLTVWQPSIVIIPGFRMRTLQLGTVSWNTALSVVLVFGRGQRYHNRVMYTYLHPLSQRKEKHPFDVCSLYTSCVYHGTHRATYYRCRWKVLLSLCIDAMCLPTLMQVASNTYERYSNNEPHCCSISISRLEVASFWTKRRRSESLTDGNY